MVFHGAAKGGWQMEFDDVSRSGHFFGRFCQFFVSFFYCQIPFTGFLFFTAGNFFEGVVLHGNVVSDEKQGVSE